MADLEPISRPSTKHQVDALKAELKVQETENEVLKERLASVVSDLHEIVKFGRNPASGMARKILAKLE